MIRLAVRVRVEDAELVLADLLELAGAGVEEKLLDAQTIEYAIYGAPGELPLLPDLRAAAGDALIEISTSEIADDWSERWKEFHRPITVASPDPGRIDAIRVRAPWERAAGRPGTQEIVIDPGQAFGTGAHATTRLCLELLLELAARTPQRGAVVDLGSGSGVLAIAAARLGYRPVLALDYDQLSVSATAANAAVNDVQIEARRFDLQHEALPAPTAQSGPVLLANLLRPLLLTLAEKLPSPPGQLIASGLLAEEAEEISAAFQRLGMREQARRSGGEWAALWLSGAEDAGSGRL